MTYRYDPKAGRLRTAVQFSNTVVPDVLRSAEFWFFLALHMAIFISFRMGFWTGPDGKLDSSVVVNWDFVKVVTAMTTFFEVFYAGQCYARYQRFYQVTKTMVNDAFAFTTNVRTFLWEKHNYARVSVRYMIGSILIHFMEMKGSVSMAEWAELVKLKIILPHELETILAYAGDQKAMYVLNWACLVGLEGCEKLKAPNSARGNVSNILLRIRANQAEITDSLALPVPFQYFHMLSVMVVVNLALWAYTMGLTDSIFSPLVFIATALIFIGMLELSAALADPFGEDEVDFPLARWLENMTELLVELVEYEYPGGMPGLNRAIETEESMPRGPRVIKVQLGNEGIEDPIEMNNQPMYKPVDSSSLPLLANDSSPGSGTGRSEEGGRAREILREAVA